MADDAHKNDAAADGTVFFAAQYSFRFGEASLNDERCRGIEGARPAGQTFHLQGDMFYDSAQRNLAMMVAREADAALAEGDLRRSTQLRAALEAGIPARTIAAWVREERPQDCYRPSFLIDYLVPARRAQDMHANLEDIYPKWVERHGARRAAWIRTMQVVLLIGGTWWEKLLSTAERLLKVVRISG